MGLEESERSCLDMDHQDGWSPGLLEKGILWVLPVGMESYVNRMLMASTERLTEQVKGAKEGPRAWQAGDRPPLFIYSMLSGFP